MKNAKVVTASGKKICAIVMSSALALTAVSGLIFSGRANAATDENAKKYYADYATNEEKDKAGNELNVEIQSEGSVLLKNEGHTLPLTGKNLTLLGAHSYDIILGGAGSGSGTGESYTLSQSLVEAGYKVNGVATALYKNIGGELNANQLGTLEPSAEVFGDAAIVTISRTGSEGWELDMHDVDGHTDKTEHYLELNDAEKVLLKWAKNNFDKVIVLINSSNTMELGPLQLDEGIDAILWIGHTGNSGVMAVGKILNGEVSPSGRLVDEYMADFKLDPTWFNYGDNAQTGGDNYIQDAQGNYYHQTKGGGKANADRYAAIEYQEGIYLSYKYYETKYFDLLKKEGKDKADKWYNAWQAKCSIDKGTEGTGVVYPFGYGLSYTEFTQTLGTVAVSEEGEGLVTVPVTVKNDGKTAGKEVVQVYYSAPYTPGGIEKSALNLVEYAKTDLLQPGEEQTVTLTFTLRDMASFDYNNANEDADGHVGYELEAGDYTISIRKDAHTEIASEVKTLVRKNFDTSEVTGKKIDNIFSKNDEYNTTTKLHKQMTREDGFTDSFPTTVEKQVYTQQEYEAIDKNWTYNPSMDKTTDLYAVTNEQIPAGWTQAANTTDTAHGRKEDGTTKVQLGELAGVEYTKYYNYAGYPSVVSGGDKKWEDYLNQLTYEEMVNIVSFGADNFWLDGAAIGLPQIYSADGPGMLWARPAQGKTNNGIFWCSEVVIACTWNVELAEAQGRMVGNDSLFNHTTGWWGPALNTHRSPFSGRFFEYYSSDGVQGGKIAAGVIKGANSKGMITYLKHFAMNDQETDRNTNRGVATWVNEQTMREIYLKVFEYAVKEGGSMGMMTGFNRIGTIPCSANYRLCNTLARDEWGFNGIYVTDLYLDCRVPGDLALRAGCDTPLWFNWGFDTADWIHGEWDATKRGNNGNVIYENAESATQYFAVRSAAQRVLYTLVNSNGMKNYTNLSEFSGSTLDAIAGAAYTKNLAANSGALVEEFELVGGSLPAGITLGANGILSGTAQVSGTYEFDVRIACDNWIDKTQHYTLNVQSAFTCKGDSLSTAALGKDFECEIESSVIKVDGTSPLNGKYTKLAFSISEGTLPEGLVFEEGIIYGTPTKTGESTFTVRLDATYEYSNGRRPLTAVETVYETYTITVGEAEAPEAPKYTVTFNTKGGSEVAAQTVTEGGKATLPTAPTKEGYTFNGWYYDEACTMTADVKNPVTENVTLYAGWSATEGSGCNGSVTGIGFAIGSLALVAAGAVAIRAAKRKQN